MYSFKYKFILVSSIWYTSIVIVIIYLIIIITNYVTSNNILIRLKKSTSTHLSRSTPLIPLFLHLSYSTPAYSTLPHILHIPLYSTRSALSHPSSSIPPVIAPTTMIFIINNVDEWNVVDGRRIDSHSNENINIVMELKVYLIKHRTPIINKPINMVSMFKKETNKRKNDKIDVRRVSFELPNVFDIKQNNF